MENEVQMVFVRISSFHFVVLLLKTYCKLFHSNPILVTKWHSQAFLYIFWGSFCLRLWTVCLQTVLPWWRDLCLRALQGLCRYSSSCCSWYLSLAESIFCSKSLIPSETCAPLISCIYWSCCSKKHIRPSWSVWSSVSLYKVPGSQEVPEEMLSNRIPVFICRLCQRTFPIVREPWSLTSKYSWPLYEVMLLQWVLWKHKVISKGG